MFNSKIPLKLMQRITNESFSKCLFYRTLSTNREKELLRRSQVNHLNIDIDRYQQKYPEFVPIPDVTKRNKVREELERRDMLNRRNNIAIPEFYVGSIMAVVTSDYCAPDKVNRFVGICIDRFGYGLNSQFVLRNVVDHQGLEINYRIYSPIVQNIEVLRLEKRLDSQLYYLRDAPHEYSTFPFDMEAEYHPDDAPVPINPMIVKLNPPPWIFKYYLMNLKGVEYEADFPYAIERSANFKKKNAWKEWDLMDEYRINVPEEEQKQIFSEITEQLREYEVKQKREKRKKIFEKQVKKNLF